MNLATGSITSGYVNVSVGGTPSTLGAAITGDDYLSFTLTNSSGQVATLETLTFDWWMNSPNASGTQSYSIYGLSDVAGITVGDEFGVRTLGEGGTPGVGFNAHTSDAAALGVSFDISSLGTLADAEAVEFRLYFVDNRSGVNSPAFRVDKISVNGMAVPEPGGAILGILGGFTLLLRRRS